MGLGPDWYQVGNKTCYVPEVSDFYVKKGYLKNVNVFLRT